MDLRRSNVSRRPEVGVVSGADRLHPRRRRRLTLIDSPEVQQDHWSTDLRLVGEHEERRHKTTGTPDVSHTVDAMDSI
jgi:hypothetical protein